ncbi:3-dehydrosphinganine reductase, partial [Linderina macrospora]
MEDWKVALITIGSILGGILVSGIISELYLRVTAPKFNVKGKHCYVTGGSQGLGKSIAEDLARQGAHVTIVARREAVLKEALEEIQKHAADKSQKFAFVCADVANKDDVERAVAEAVKKQGQEIEYAFLSAGVSNPGFFVEQSADVLEQTMKVNYFGSLFNAHAIARRM